MTQRNLDKVVRDYPNDSNTPQNMGELKMFLKSDVKAPVWKFKPTLTLDMMTSEGIRELLKERLDVSPEEFYKTCRETGIKDKKGNKLGVATTFGSILRHLFTVPRSLTREIHRLINKDSDKYGFGPFRKHDAILNRTETHRAISDNLEYLINGIKNAQTRNIRNPVSRITTSLSRELKIPKIKPKTLVRYLKQIEIYYVDKTLTLACDYLDTLSLYHMGKINKEETMDKMFVGPESIKRELMKIDSYFLIKTIAYKEGFLPVWFFKCRLQPRTSIEFDSERRFNLYKNATLTALDLRDLYKESVDTWGYAKCAISGDRLFFDYWTSQDQRSKTCNISVDRLTEDSQYTKEGVQLTTRKANVAKHLMTNEEFAVLCSKVVKHQKETKDKAREQTTTNQLDLYSEFDLWPLE